MDFYVGPAVLTLDDETIGVTAFIDSSGGRGMHVWGGFLDTGTHDKDLRFKAIEAKAPRLALPGRASLVIDVIYTSGGGIGFTGTGTSPMETSDQP